MIAVGSVSRPDDEIAVLKTDNPSEIRDLIVNVIKPDAGIFRTVTRAAV